MKATLHPRALPLAAALACACAAAPAHAGLIANGGFESGLSGWTVVNQLGSDGTFFLHSGTASPLNGFAVPAPPQGSRAAMTDAGAGGSHVLYQDFTVPAGIAGGTIGFSLFVNSGEAFRAPATLDWATPALNQQARVDILAAGSDPFSTAAGDVLLNLFRTQPGDAPTSGYVVFSADISSLLLASRGQTLRLRFAEVDNVSSFNLGVDQVAIEPLAVPEPAALALLGLGLAGWAAGRRSARRPASA